MLRAGEASVSIEIVSVNGQEDVGVVDLGSYDAIRAFVSFNIGAATAATGIVGAGEHGVCWWENVVVKR